MMKIEVKNTKNVYIIMKCEINIDEIGQHCIYILEVIDDLLIITLCFYKFDKLPIKRNY